MTTVDNFNSTAGGEAAVDTAAAPKTSSLRRARPERKVRASQVPYGLALIAACIAFGFYINAMEVSDPNVMGSKNVLIWAIGVGFGFCLVRSRFCFTASLRDPVLTGGTNVTKAVLIGLGASTLLFTGLNYNVFLKTGGEMELYEAAIAAKEAKVFGSLAPVGVHTAVGAFIFGFGAVIAGGCASGTLMRMGEGFLQQWVVLPAFIAGSVIGVATYDYWKVLLDVDLSNKVYLPTLFDSFFVALVVQFALLGGLYLVADWWGKRDTGHAKPE